MEQEIYIAAKYLPLRIDYSKMPDKFGILRYMFAITLTGGLWWHHLIFWIFKLFIAMPIAIVAELSYVVIQIPLLFVKGLVWLLIRVLNAIFKSIIAKIIVAIAILMLIISVVFYWQTWLKWVSTLFGLLE